MILIELLDGLLSAAESCGADYRCEHNTEPSDWNLRVRIESTKDGRDVVVILVNRPVPPANAAPANIRI